nr:pentatricopeptide repeat-containing protein At5g48730, chloroplastic [Tanacetum cinerariifolium]
MIDEGCIVNQESYTALLSAYSRSGLFRKAFSILDEMKNTPDCQPDVYTYSILIKSCLHYHEFDKVQSLLSEMVSQGVKPNTVTYNTLIDAYGKAKRPNSAIYVKLIVMLGKCKQPEKAHSLFQAMIDEGCIVNQESYTALLSAYSRSGLFRKAFSILDEMKNTPDCQPDVYTYSILIKSCLHYHEFDKVQSLLSEMVSQGVKPNTVTYNTLIDAYGKAKR